MDIKDMTPRKSSFEQDITSKEDTLYPELVNTEDDTVNVDRADATTNIPKGRDPWNLD